MREGKRKMLMSSFSAQVTRGPGILQPNREEPSCFLAPCPLVSEGSEHFSRMPTVYTSKFSPKIFSGGTSTTQAHVPQCLHLFTRGPWIQAPGNRSETTVYRQEVTLVAILIAPTVCTGDSLPRSEGGVAAPWGAASTEEQGSQPTLTPTCQE